MHLFASKELRKAIYTRSRFRNSLTVNYASSSETNVSLFEKNQSNIFFSNIASNGVKAKKYFLKAIKGFLTNKGYLKNRARSLVVSDLRSDIKDSGLESGC